MASIGLTLANRGVIIGAVTVPELFDMAKRAEDSGAFSAVWVGDSLLAKPRLESITLLSALAAITNRVKLAVGCMATFSAVMGSKIEPARFVYMPLPRNAMNCVPLPGSREI